MKQLHLNGATLSVRGQAQGVLTPRLVTTVISNIAAASIGGAFVNLADKAAAMVDSNTLKASYSGADGMA